MDRKVMNHESWPIAWMKTYVGVIHYLKIPKIPVDIPKKNALIESLLTLQEWIICGLLDSPDIRTCHSLWFGGSGLGPIFRAAISPESTEDSNPNGLKARFDEDYLDVPGS